ncbi:hypothetical protein [Actinomadura sp. WMMA1423]|uniref:hypothetical protein n=1 Tax=Actinomadura sp. WMMA1423 TaxID=2591108 RepID=UPI00114775AF|nr:hypothetical protein [Actinomadura sp. WMMA1423]
MILTSTYRDHTVPPRDLLAAFSPLDHATTAGLDPDAVEAAYERLLRRLAVLIALHGPDAPARYLNAVAAAAPASSNGDAGDTDPEEAGQDLVDLTAAFLDHGRAHGPGEISELQQELVHFSRIVDIGQLGLQGGVAEHSLRRLRGSHRLPDSLKVLSELIIVARSRLLQRGPLLPVPHLRPGQTTEADVDEDMTTSAPASSPDYWMVVRSGRRRLRRQFRYELSALLAYLTPAEAALALWAHCHEQRLGVCVELALVQVDAVGGVTSVNWRYQAPGPSGDTVARVTATLPTVHGLSAGMSATVCGHQVVATSPTSARVVAVASDVTAAELHAPAAERPTPAELAASAVELIGGYSGPPLVSMEAGHIHLDRDLDGDQDAGAAIGAALLSALGERQQQPPVLTPMMDDDHVLVRLTPDTYVQFLRRAFPTAPMHLICESSPILRSIVVALFQRMRNSRLANRLQMRGANLFLPLDDGNHVELFEDFDGDPITGCVLFEVALLIYRSAPERFDTYFIDRYGLYGRVHDHAASILSRAAGGHDVTVAELRGYYQQFADVTDPHRPDAHITGLVTNVLAGADPVYAHLNVLEDYYEVQQRRVRALIGLLSLPLRLVTVHFNATTGRVVLADE